MDTLLVTALYKFVRLDDYEELREPLLLACQKYGVTGSLLLAAEGINGTIAGSAEDVHRFVRDLQRDPRFLDLELKESSASRPPFLRMKVKLKKEIVTMGVPGVDPLDTVGAYVAPEDWNALIADPSVVLVDTRNDYEVRIGTFRGAKDPHIKNFRSFPDWLRHELAGKDSPKVAMFCTGGIRCEKATSWLLGEGIDEVYHLKGGILKYLEVVPEADSLWEGECFVFDERVAVKHGLQPGSYELCRACRDPISEADKQSPLFEFGLSCPHCAARTTAQQKQRYAERTKQVALAKAHGTRHLGITCNKDQK